MSQASYPIEGDHGFEVVHEHNATPQPWDWVVRLPHQCDEWEIASGADPEAVLVGLDAFIAEAQQARAKLAELAAEPRT